MTMLLSSPQIASWNVVFMDRPEKRWWDIFCRQRFKHVMAFGYSPTCDAWVFVNPGEIVTEIGVVEDGDLDGVLADFTPWTLDIVVMDVNNDAPFSLRSKLGGWCVFTIDQLLGRNSGALSPYGLYKNLLAHGGRSWRAQQEKEEANGGSSPGSTGESASASAS